MSTKLERARKVQRVRTSPALDAPHATFHLAPARPFALESWRCPRCGRPRNTHRRAPCPGRPA